MPARRPAGLIARCGGDLRRAAAFLTRWPLPPPPDGDRPVLTAGWAFPAVGALVGLLGGAVFALAAALGLDAPAAGVLALAATALATGALHEDGLADFADGCAAGGDARRRLAAMRDSRTGAAGVLALILVTLAKLAALGGLGAAGPGPAVAGLVLAHAAGRAAPVGLAWIWRPADEAGLAAAAGRPDRAGAGLAGLTALLIGLLVAGPAAVAALFAAALAALLTGLAARRLLGGHTGDVLGAAEQLAEAVALLALAAL